MSKVAKESFKHYTELPPELRMFVVEEMEPDDRCRFTRCSKMCGKEAKSSKNYMRSLALHIDSEVSVRIVVTHGEANLFYILEFEVEGGRKWMKCKSRENEELWKISIDLENSVALVQYSVQHFKKILQLYQNTIKNLHIDTGIDDIEIDNNFEISRMKNLEGLSIDGDLNAQQFISKIRFPLKNLKVLRDDYTTIQKEDIYEVREILNYPDVQLSKEEMLQLSAQRVTMSIGNLTPEDVYNFIKSWRSDNFGGKSVTWNIRWSDFDVEAFLNLSGRENYSENPFFKTMHIQLDKETGKSASLYCGIGSLSVFFNGF